MHELEKIKLIAGLGNPGEEYAETYHNVGIIALEETIKNLKDGAAPKKFRDIFINHKSGGKIFLKPLCFMNESGGTLKTALKHFGIKPEDLLVIHDDSDIEIGNFKLSFGRNSGGHKGVESIIKSLRTKNFWRFRIGIRPKMPPSKAVLPTLTRRTKAEEFVLKRMSDHDKKIFLPVFKKIAEKIYNLLNNAETH